MKENKFDELAKGLAQSTTRRQALKKFGVGLAGIALACFGLADKAHATKACVGPQGRCSINKKTGLDNCCGGLACLAGPGEYVGICNIGMGG